VRICAVSAVVDVGIAVAGGAASGPIIGGADTLILPRDAFEFTRINAMGTMSAVSARRWLPDS
jgi:hypothetical protein